MADRTIDVGYVHVGVHEWKNGAEMEWVCAGNCPHPDHDEDTSPRRQVQSERDAG